MSPSGTTQQPLQKPVVRSEPLPKNLRKKLREAFERETWRQSTGLEIVREYPRY
jgi:hypothetical protein